MPHRLILFSLIGLLLLIGILSAPLTSAEAPPFLNSTVTALATSSQTVTPPATPPGEVTPTPSYRWRNYRSLTGWPRYTGLAVYGDDVWLTTSAGLVRWNWREGRYVEYTTAEGLPGGGIRAITVDSAGQLWLGTHFSLARFDGQSWTSFIQGEGPEPRSARQIFIDQARQVWTSNGDFIISKFDGLDWTDYSVALDTYPKNPGHTDIQAYIQAITVNRDGHLWVGASYGGVGEFNGETWITHFPIKLPLQGTPTPGIKAIVTDIKGNVWVGANGSLRQYDGQTWVTYDAKNGLLNSDVSALAVDSKGYLWVGSQAHGVSRFDGRTWTLYTEAEGLASNGITALTTDVAGRVWVATANGVSMFDGQTWTSYPIAAGSLASNEVNAVVIDRAGRKWFGTGSGINVFDGQSWVTYGREDVTDDSVMAIAIDAAGQVWATTWREGVRVFNGQTWRAFTVDDGLVNNWVEAIAVDKAGHVWFGTQNGVSEFDGQTWRSYTTADGLADNFINTVAVDNEGHLWFATKNGVSEFDGQTWHTYTVTDGLANNVVNDLAIDETGTKWFATENGVSQFDGKSWRTYTPADGLAGYDINAIATDKMGNIWASTHGLAKFNRFDGQNWTVVPVGIPGCDTFKDLATDEAGHQWFVDNLCGVLELDDTTSSPTLEPVERSLPTVTPTPSATPEPNPALQSWPVKAQNLELVGHLGGQAQAATIQDNYIYASFGSEFTILDVSNPAQPVRVGYIVLPDTLNQIILDNHYAYGVAPNGRLWVIDVANPAAPISPGFYKPARFCKHPAVDPAITIIDRYAYLAAGESLYILDITNPTQPVEVGVYETYEYFSDSVAVVGNYAFVGKCHSSGEWPCPGSLQILDISNPAAPQQVAFYELPAPSSPVAQIVIKDHYAFLVGNSDGQEASDLWVLDIANPVRPVDMGSYAIGAATDIVLNGSYAYLANRWQGLRIMNISDPTHLVEVGRVPGETPFVTVIPRTQLSGQSYLVTSGLNGAGLRLFDVSKPDAPKEIGRHRVPTYLSNLMVAGEYAYLSYLGEKGGAEIDIVNISNPVYPFLISRYKAPPFRPDQLPDNVRNDPNLTALLDTNRIRDFAIAGDTLYVATGECPEVLQICRGNLRIVNISKPATPVEVGVYDAPGLVQEVKGNDTYVYLRVRSAWYTSTLHIIDVSQPTRPIEVGSYPNLPGGIGTMAVAEQNNEVYVYLTHQDGLDIINVSAPTAPVKVGAVKTPQKISQVTIVGDYAYLNTSPLTIIDISEPTAPKEVGRSYGEFNRFSEVRLVGIKQPDPSGRVYAYFQDFDVDGLWVVDVTDPATPIYIGAYGDGQFSSIDASGNLIYTTGNGLFIFRLTP